MVLVAASLALFTQAGVGGSYVVGRAAGDDPARLRDRGLLPGADVARDVGRDAAATPDSPPGWSTRRLRSAARSASRSSRPCRRRARDNLLADGKSQAAALTSGYHLAFWIGAALVVAAIAVAATVLQPEKEAAAQASEADPESEHDSGRREPAYADAA